MPINLDETPGFCPSHVSAIQPSVLLSSISSQYANFNSTTKFSFWKILSAHRIKWHPISSHSPALTASQLLSFVDSALLQYSIMSQGSWIPMVNRSLKEMNAEYSFQMSGHFTTLCRVPEQSPLLQKPQNLCVLSFSCPVVLSFTEFDPFPSTVGRRFLLQYLCGTDSYMAWVCCLFFRVVWEASALIVYFRIIFVHICYNTFQLQ